MQELHRSRRTLDLPAGARNLENLYLSRRGARRFLWFRRACSAPDRKCGGPPWRNLVRRRQVSALSGVAAAALALALAPSTAQAVPSASDAPTKGAAKHDGGPQRGEQYTWPTVDLVMAMAMPRSVGQACLKAFGPGNLRKSRIRDTGWPQRASSPDEAFRQHFLGPGVVKKLAASLPQVRRATP